MNMTPSRMNKEQNVLIESLMAENEHLREVISEMEYKHKITTSKLLNVNAVGFRLGERNFRISLILSVLLIIETLYILRNW